MILKFSEDEFRKICYEDHDNFDLIEKIEGTSTGWSREITIIVKCIENDKFYMGAYYEGATEMQEDEFLDTEMQECEKIEVVKFEWIPKEENDED